MSFAHLLKTVTHLGSPTVLLAGDFMLDSYIYGDALRISPEAPVQVLKVVDRQYCPGGAASVAADITTLEARCLCIGTVGDDNEGRRLLELLSRLNADCSGLLTVRDRPTISKQRIIGLAQHRHRQQLLRIDDECTNPYTPIQYEQLFDLFRRQLTSCDVVCLQDYNKGLLVPDFCRRLIEAARKAGKKVLVDPPLQSDYSKFTGATVITPNRKETAAAVGFPIETIDDAARAAALLHEQLQLEAVVITLDKEGAYLRTDDIDQHIPTVPRVVYDVTGAGDMMLAVLAVTLAAGCDWITALQIANIAAGLEVEKFGVATVSIDEIVNEIISRSKGKTGKIRDDWSVLLKELQLRRRQKETIVFTNGCFDVLHRGHIEYLNFCRQQGDVVVVGLNSDASVRALKGPDRPINNQHDRAAVLAALESVDYVVFFDDLDPLRLIQQIRPDVLVKGADWAQKGVVGREFVESYGGVVKLAPLVEGKSSTNIIQQIRSGQAGSRQEATPHDAE
ncbi:MAG TPA: D-glycero-beta-D-manno-heptose 1-phosphate adenylyltransferase [Anaerohalosphaeraceae bacterium]|nr:D-glycero-beta-D-manno-heptose 1-phosphate adenylyltransferase [Anaerohalosphaeraceae bacterium]HOL87960.1 D-glycero-beta-D-manno-heptose 1-phosphate adenylyltransferase [Anaerohalosphaeraceae bacterium]HPP55459.1 D-glycero-beta-D-manno-heptose 1-phosphate adenylyltransferase [Anaerohalosphaeraceae bacterium]